MSNVWYENPHLKPIKRIVFHRSTGARGMTYGNSQKLARLQQVWKELLEEVLKRDFYGIATVELKIQEGTIQAIHQKVERIER